jgi:hypothetical protein
MTLGDIAVGALIAAWAIGAILILVRNRRRGRNSCGCNCMGCPSARRPNVTIEDGDECDCCKKQ